MTNSELKTTSLVTSPAAASLPQYLRGKATPENFEPTAWHEFIITVCGSPKAFSPDTLRAYASDIKKFAAYCKITQQKGLPATPHTLAGFIKSEIGQGRKFRTIERAITAIKFMHQYADLDNPAEHKHVDLALKDAARTLGMEQKQQYPIRLAFAQGETQAILLADLLEAAGKSIRGLRDQLLLSFGIDLGVRGSELAAIEHENIRIGKKGGEVFIKAPKGDARKQGVWKPFSELTSYIYQEWLDQTDIKTGPLLLQTNKAGIIVHRGLQCRSITNIIKRLTKDAGYAEQYVQGVSSHSFRIGLAQQLYLEGESLGRIMKAQGWKSAKSALRYLENLSVQQNASAHMFANLRSLSAPTGNDNQ